ncbi:MAG: SufE family protein [Sphingobacteriales bacterium]|jgi:cysteine desulfuration protein SufE
MSSIAEIQQEIVEEFALFDTWEEKYEYLIDMGKKLVPIHEQYRTEDNKIKGCQSQVWLHSTLENGKVIFHADSDAMIVKGLVSMLVRVFSGQKPEAIVEASVTFIDDIGMTSHLAQTRSNGLRAMLKQIKLDALAWQSKSSTT